MKTILSSLRLLVALTVLTGIVYPLLVTAVGKTFWPRQASGSLVRREGQAAGSELLAQRFASDRYFWPRPSAGDDGTNYATVASGASNLGPTSSNLVAKVQERAAAFRAAHGLAADAPVPADMLFTSGSGLDPHISPESARLQIARVAKARQWPEARRKELAALVERMIEPPQGGFLGEPRVNVLKLNLAADQL